jgi:nucleoside-diphosphate-sugar epimerase
MKVLITGAGGYIGSVLTPMLLKSGYSVTAVDNFMYRQNTLLDCCHYKNFTIIRGDVRNNDLMRDLIRKNDVDIIIPLACIVGAPACDKDPITAKSINLDAIQKILDLKNTEQKIVFPNTNSGYGIGQGEIRCDETSPLNPLSLYGELKIEAEKRILEHGNSIALRLATVFGASPRMRLDLLVNDFVYRAVTDHAVTLFESHFKRNYIHVRDVARAFIHCIENFDAMKNESYNIGLSNANLSKWELCEEIKKYVPEFYFTEAEIGEDPDKRNYIVSNAKIEATGFIPKVSLSDGIEELIKVFEIVRQNQFSNI